jgi:hypothetical protein
VIAIRSKVDRERAIARYAHEVGRSRVGHEELAGLASADLPDRASFQFIWRFQDGGPMYTSRMGITVIAGLIAVGGAFAIYRSYFLGWRIRLLETNVEEVKSLCIALARDTIFGGNEKAKGAIASMRLANLAIASFGKGPDADEARAQLDEFAALDPAYRSEVELLKAKVSLELLRHGFPEITDFRLDARLR